MIQSCSHSSPDKAPWDCFTVCCAYSACPRLCQTGGKGICLCMEGALMGDLPFLSVVNLMVTAPGKRNSITCVSQPLRSGVLCPSQRQSPSELKSQSCCPQGFLYSAPPWFLLRARKSPEASGRGSMLACMVALGPLCPPAGSSPKTHI